MSFVDFAFTKEVITLLIKIGFILLFTVILANIINIFLAHSFRRASKNIKVDETQFRVLRRLIVFIIYISGIVLAASRIPGFSGLSTSLLASAGILAVVVGFAAQQTFSNIISGIFIATFKPFKVGDRVTIQGEYGTVEDITLRHTIVNTWKNERIVIPNAKINEEYITNYSMKDPAIVGTVEINISYDSDIDKAKKIMIEEVMKHPNMAESKSEDSDFLAKKEKVRVRLVEITDFAQKLRLYYWAKDQPTSVKMKFDLLESIKKRFDKEGIEIPYPYHTIVYKDKKEPKKKEVNLYVQRK